MSEWQPIETAPKDGTAFLVCSPYRYPHTVACVVWEPVHQSWACSWDNWPLEAFVATHWMPLPSSPQQKEQP